MQSWLAFKLWLGLKTAQLAEQAEARTPTFQNRARMLTMNTPDFKTILNRMT